MVRFCLIREGGVRGRGERKREKGERRGEGEERERGEAKSSTGRGRERKGGVTFLIPNTQVRVPTRQYRKDISIIRTLANQDTCYRMINQLQLIPTIP